MKRRENLCIIILFIFAIALVPAAIFLLPDRSFSENENRYLAQKPMFGMQNVMSGKWMEDMQEYVADQFPARDFFNSFTTCIRQLAGQKEINGVYLCEDGYLIKAWRNDEFDREQTENNLDAVNAFAAVHSEQETTMMIVPTAGLIFKDKLPEGAPVFDQNIALDMAQSRLRDCLYIDLREVMLQNCDRYIYYKTDHHWTTHGAYLAYREWRKQQKEELPEIDYEIRTVTEQFRGSLYSKVLNREQAYDSIDLYIAPGQETYTVKYNFGKEESGSIYSLKCLEEKDKYRVFLNGNHPELTICSSNANGKHLLVFKDSYANAFLPFIIDAYETTHVIDLRYFNRDIEQYISDNDITAFLFLYNVESFSEDTHAFEVKLCR